MGLDKRGFMYNVIQDDGFPVSVKMIFYLDFSRHVASHETERILNDLEYYGIKGAEIEDWNKTIKIAIGYPLNVDEQYVILKVCNTLYEISQEPGVRPVFMIGSHVDYMELIYS